MRYFYLTPVLSGPGSARYPIGDQMQLIGRSEHAEISLLEPTVSRRHATIHCDEGRVVLKDLGSKHGTFVNSKRVTSARLKSGDIVVFGLSLVLRLEATEQPLPAVEGARASPTTDFGEDLGTTAIRTVTIPPIGRPTSSSTHEDIGRIQNQMAKVHKLAAAGAACVQHLPELVARLSAIREHLTDRAVVSPELHRTMDAFDGALAGLNRLSYQLSLVPRRRPELTSIAEVVDAAVGVTSAEATACKIQLTIKVNADLMVVAENHRLAHAVSELIRNAVRHSPPEAVVQIIASRRSDAVLLSVIDCGEGFAADILESACDPFVTRSGAWEALGLGLFEARQIAMTYGGALEIDSRPGLTTVQLLLPGAR